jgi:probable HAF family extracellular repeat protein
VTLIRDGAVNTRAFGINNAGQVVGTAAIYATAGATYGFIYNGGNFTNLSAPGVTPGNGGSTVALGINSTGQIVGYAGGVVSPGGVVGPYEGFLYSGGAYQILSVPGATNTYANGINSTGEIVGYWDSESGTREGGFIYQNGVYTAINVPGATSTQPRAINDLGQILGTYVDASHIAHFFIYENGNYDVITVLLGGQAFLGPAVQSGGVNGINKAGQIVGFGTTSNCLSCAFVANPVVKLKK